MSDVKGGGGEGQTHSLFYVIKTFKKRYWCKFFIPLLIYLIYKQGVDASHADRLGKTFHSQ